MMKIIVNQVKKTKEVKNGQIYKRNDDYYLVAVADRRDNIVYYNLTNLTDGGRWTHSLTKEQLQIEITQRGFTLVNAVSLTIQEEI